jgi:hypothetical protein
VPQSVYQRNRSGNFTDTVPGLTPGAEYTAVIEPFTAVASSTGTITIPDTMTDRSEFT